MRLGVTGRSRTGTGGFTAHGSAIELRSHPSARGEAWLRRFPFVRARRPAGAGSSNVPSWSRNWWVRMDSNHRANEDLVYSQAQSTALPHTLGWYLVHDSNVRPPAS